MDDGTTSLTTIVTVVVASPPVLVAVMVYVAEAVIAVGVPLITPVDESITNPAGSDGSTAQEMTVPPLDVGEAADIAESFVNVNGLPLYETEDGITSLTTMVTVVVELPPLLVAVTVKVAEEVIAVGVPLITPVEESIANPAGSVEETDQEITVPPLDVGDAGDIKEPFVNVNGLPLYETEDGITSLTTMVTVVVASPPVLVAVMV